VAALPMQLMGLLLSSSAQPNPSHAAPMSTSADGISSCDMQCRMGAVLVAEVENWLCSLRRVVVSRTLSGTPHRMTTTSPTLHSCERHESRRCTTVHDGAGRPFLSWRSCARQCLSVLPLLHVDVWLVFKRVLDGRVEMRWRF
jgi:hypothetical protein